MNINPMAGKPVSPSILVNVARLVTAYYAEQPDPSMPEERVATAVNIESANKLIRSGEAK
jgi:phosphoglucomutase